MNCERVRDFLSPHLDDALLGTEREAVHQHLQVCSSCREHFEGLAQVVALIRGIPPLAAPGRFRQGVLAGLPPRRTGKGRLARLIPAAAAAVLLVSFGYLGAVHFRPEAGGPPVEVGLVSSPRDEAAFAQDDAPLETAAAPQGPAFAGPAAATGTAWEGTAAPGDGLAMGGGAGGLVPSESKPEDCSVARDQESSERSLSYVVRGGEPDATAGLILAELQNRRSRSTREDPRGAARDDGARAVLERVVADPEGEPARLVLYLTADEVRYILTLLARRSGATRVAGRRAEEVPTGAPLGAEGPAGAKLPKPEDVPGPLPPVSLDGAVPNADAGEDRDGSAQRPHRFRVELRFDR
jgi:hypothetical protein